MSTAILRDGSDALKVFTHGRVDIVRKLVDLTQQLQTAGVPVPVSNIDMNETAIRLPWIQGQTMRQLMGKAGPDKTQIHSAMQVLQCLHQSGVRPVGLKVFDPFRLSVKRLKQSWFLFLARQIQSDALTLRSKLDEVPTSRSGLVIIHGDFHAGQLILEMASQKWWLIDLDDVALGHKEADVANFCVNIATRDDHSAETIDLKLNEMFATCESGYGSKIEFNLFRYYAACALLRRALKFAERSEPENRIRAILRAGLALR
jgi:aminoglycoside phosphotransferase (APT) family kinase protein